MKGNEGDNVFFSTSVEVLVGAQQELLGAPTDFTCTPAALTETQQNKDRRAIGALRCCQMSVPSNVRGQTAHLLPVSAPQWHAPLKVSQRSLLNCCIRPECIRAAENARE